MSYNICPGSDLTSFSMIISRFIHVVANGTTLFFYVAENIPLYVYTTSSLSIPLTMDI